MSFVEYKNGNLFEADVEAIVNTVNCVGIMGKGIALQFKKNYPENFKAYQKACKAELIQPGQMFVFETGTLINPRYIINFPTKRHWKGKSKIEDIKSGLDALISDIKQLNIKSIAVPPLGCGNGGLQWSKVKPLIDQAFAQVSDIQVYVFEPTYQPDTIAHKIHPVKTELTRARALFILLIDQYVMPGYQLTLLELQKLAYFLQVTGEPLKLRYQKLHYGPYADNLNKVLEVLEGSFIKGYNGSNQPHSEIELMDNAVEQARTFIQSYEDSLKRLETVSDLIRGFEYPYGMELLSTVHWLIQENPQLMSDPDAVVSGVHTWSARKKKLFSADDIKLALKRVQEYRTA